ncbi:MAG: glycosyltransferase family 4 protein, partial [Candidatus Poseidoniaceae archaeon]
MEPSEVDAPLSVLLVHVWYWPHIGGGNQHVEHIARQLVARGHKATVWCADIPEHDEKRFVRDGVDVIRLPPKRVLGGIDPVVSIKDLDMNFDIVHLHDTLPVLIRRSVKRARKEKIPVVTTFHNDYIKTSLGGKILKRIRWALQGRRTLHASNARIALTPYYAKHLKSRGVRKSIDVLPNGFEPVAEDAVRPSTFPVDEHERPLLVFVGRLSEQKGLDVLMDAWDSLCQQGEPNARLAIAGSGELDEWLDDRIASSTYPQSIAKLGRVEDSEKRWLFEQARSVLIPSRFEGLPTVLLEAMHAGAPTVMADVNDLGRLVTEPNAGLSVTPG